MLIAAGTDPADIPAHLETRPGKRRWLEREQEPASTAAEVSAETETAPIRPGKRRWLERESDTQVRTSTPPTQASL